MMLRLPNGSSSWVPAASTRNAASVTDDKNILWEDFCQAAPRMIVAMEESDWPQDRVAMLAKFWGNLQMHEYRFSRDPLDQRMLIVYQAEQRRLWHLAISSPQGAYNLSRINEEIMRKTRDKVYCDEHCQKDYQRNFRVRFSCYFFNGYSTKVLLFIHSAHPFPPLFIFFKQYATRAAYCSRHFGVSPRSPHATSVIPDVSSLHTRN